MTNPTQILFSIIISTSLAAITSHQHVKFVPRTPDVTPKKNVRTSRSYRLPYTDFYSEHFWPGLVVHEDDDLILDVSSFSFSDIPRFHHITPDFSDGLAYPDPFLLVGRKASIAAHRLYSKELFFGNYPHVRALLYNKRLRLANGLRDFRLGSLRPNSPWDRNKRMGFGFRNTRLL